MLMKICELSRGCTEKAVTDHTTSAAWIYGIQKTMLTETPIWSHRKGVTAGVIQVLYYYLQ